MASTNNTDFYIKIKKTKTKKMQTYLPINKKEKKKQMS